MALLQRIEQVWLRQVEVALEVKEARFAEDARRAWRFYGEKNHRFLYFETDSGELARDVERPRYRATLNKTFEFVTVMLPYIYHRVPTRLVRPRQPAVPPEVLGVNIEAGEEPPGRRGRLAASALLDWFLNYTPTEFGLREEARDAATEALVKGRGVLWTDLVETGAGPMPGSFFDSVDYLIVDPNAERMRTASWIGRFRRRPVWEVAQEYGVPENELRATSASRQSESLQRIWKDYGEPRASEEVKDVLEYWEIYSACGMGQRFAAATKGEDDIFKALEAVGDHCFLAITPGLGYPMNLDPRRIKKEPDKVSYVRDQSRWPIPFYHVKGSPWPCTFLDFHPRERSAWPISILAPALPIQAFLDYAWSWLIERIKQTGRLIPVVSAAAQEEFKQAITGGYDLEAIYLKNAPQGVNVSELFGTIQFPPVNADLWTILAGLERQFESLTGMAPLLRGDVGQTQPRSSREIDVREAATMSRPDDLADCVDEFMSTVERKEGMAARRHVSPATIARLAGENVDLMPTETNPFPEEGPVTRAWRELVSTADPWVASAELEYTVQAQSGRRPNKARRQAYLREMGQIVLQPFMTIYFQTGDPGPFNGFIRLLAESHDEDPTEMMLPDLRNRPPAAAGQPSQTEEEAA